MINIHRQHLKPIKPLQTLSLIIQDFCLEPRDFQTLFYSLNLNSFLSFSTRSCFPSLSSLEMYSSRSIFMKKSESMGHPQLISSYRQEVNIEFLLQFFYRRRVNCELFKYAHMFVKACHLSKGRCFGFFYCFFKSRKYSTVECTGVKQVVGTHQNLNSPGNGNAPYLPYK